MSNYANTRRLVNACRTHPRVVVRTDDGWVTGRLMNYTHSPFGAGFIVFHVQHDSDGRLRPVAEDRILPVTCERCGTDRALQTDPNALAIGIVFASHDCPDPEHMGR